MSLLKMWGQYDSKTTILFLNACASKSACFSFKKVIYWGVKASYKSHLTGYNFKIHILTRVHYVQ